MGSGRVIENCTIFYPDLQADIFGGGNIDWLHSEIVPLKDLVKQCREIGYEWTQLIEHPRSVANSSLSSTKGVETVRRPEGAHWPPLQDIESDRALAAEVNRTRWWLDKKFLLMPKIVHWGQCW